MNNLKEHFIGSFLKVVERESIFVSINSNTEHTDNLKKQGLFKDEITKGEPTLKKAAEIQNLVKTARLQGKYTLRNACIPPNLIPKI